MRNFKLIIPSDCIGSNTTEVNILFKKIILNLLFYFFFVFRIGK
jgi:hypothetical protein